MCPQSPTLAQLIEESQSVMRKAEQLKTEQENVLRSLEELVMGLDSEEISHPPH
jgi:hypothetical protein